MEEEFVYVHIPGEEYKIDKEETVKQRELKLIAYGDKLDVERKKLIEEGKILCEAIQKGGEQEQSDGKDPIRILFQKKIDRIKEIDGIHEKIGKEFKWTQNTMNIFCKGIKLE